MVSETASTPTCSMLLRSSTRTPSAHVRIEVGSPKSVSKISTKRKASKNASSSIKKNKTEKEEEEKAGDVIYEEFEENNVVDEGNPAKDESKQAALLTEDDYIIPKKDWKYLQVNPMGISTKVVSEIQLCLNDDKNKVELFKKYNVGHLLSLLESNVSFWGSLIHAVLIHQVYNPIKDELTFLFGGKKMRFGCREFCILTGLQYAGREEIYGGSNRLLDKYGNEGKLQRQELLEAFKQCTNVEDQVKLCVAYLVESLLFAKAPITLIDPKILAIVDDVAAFNKVCWGKLSWEFLVPKLKESIIKKRTKFKGGYSLHGFLDVVSIYAMETIPELEKVGVVRIRNGGFSRILNWNMVGKGGYAALAATVFKQPMSPTKIELTNEEAKHPNFAGMSNDIEDVEKHVNKQRVKDVVVLRDDAPPRRSENTGSKTMMETITALEKDMECMRGLVTRLSTSLAEERIQVEKKMADQDKKIKLQEQKINEQGHQINQLFQMLKVYSPQGVTPSEVCPLSSPIGQFSTPLPIVMKTEEHSEKGEAEEEANETKLRSHIQTDIKTEKQTNLQFSEKKLEEEGSISVVSVSEMEYKKYEEKRKQKPNPKYLGTPWTPDGKSKRRRTTNSQIMQRKFRDEYEPVLPLDPMRQPLVEDGERFVAWCNKYETIFTKDKTKPLILPADEHMDFTVSVVDTYDFWYRLKTPNAWLMDEEMDVILYYIRQKQRYLLEKFDDTATCGNTIINSLFVAQYDEYRRKSEAGEKWETDSRIVKFLLGELRHGKRCHEVNTIYLPMNQPNEHWFLAAVRLNEWRIDVFDSFYVPRRREAKLEIVRPLASMLPQALEDVKFFDARSKLAKYKNMEFNIEYNKKACPQQSGSDCGFFVLKFIEFLLTKGLDINKCVQETMTQMRFNTCVSLYDHGLQKRNGMYDSDDD